MRPYGICHMNKVSAFLKKPKEHSQNILSMQHHQTLKVQEVWPWAWGPWKGKKWINIVCITQWKAFCCNNLRRPKQEPWLVMHGLQGAPPSLSLCYLLHRQIFASFVFHVWSVASVGKGCFAITACFGFLFMSPIHHNWMTVWIHWMQFAPKAFCVGFSGLHRRNWDLE